jgi:hypothetical protein
MRTDFIPNNIEFWVLNWKRKNLINDIMRSWLVSFPFNCVNLISNHSSITEDCIDRDIKPKVKVWRNVLRHDAAVGPITRNMNEAHLHTFLAGKKYCLVIRDDMLAIPGWHECIINSNYDYYSGPQGGQIQLTTLDGFRTFGWWDERYSTNTHFELDHISRTLHKCLYENAKASLMDIHWWEPNPQYTVGTNLVWNDVGLTRFVKRIDHGLLPQHGPKGAKFDALATAWQKQKWHGCYDGKQPGYQTSIKGVHEGPSVDEINWYPWLDLNDLSTCPVAIT